MEVAEFSNSAPGLPEGRDESAVARIVRCEQERLNVRGRQEFGALEALLIAFAHVRCYPSDTRRDCLEFWKLVGAEHPAHEPFENALVRRHGCGGALLLQERTDDALEVFACRGVEVLAQQSGAALENDERPNQAHLPAYLLQEASVAEPEDQGLVPSADVASGDQRFRLLVLLRKIMDIQRHAARHHTNHPFIRRRTKNTQL